MHGIDALGAPEPETIALASLSDTGRVRPANQDAVALIENTSGERILIVADGMGGHRGGETASRICLEVIERVFREPHGTPEERLRRGFELANEEIYSHSLANPELGGMGTTAVAALLAPAGGAWVAWVGDSRCYRLRDRVLEPLTQDHSLMAEWISIGVISAEAAKQHPRRHELTRALGQAPDVSIDLVAIELRAGDRLLLCSDGLHGYVEERPLAQALASGSVEEASRALVDAANERGGADNVSVVVAALPDAPAPVPAPVPEPGPELHAELAVQEETSFAGLDAEISHAEAEPEAAPSPEPEPGFLPPEAQQIHIPLMTPVQLHRRLDLTSLVAGASATLVIAGIGIGIWGYTTKSRPIDGHSPSRQSQTVIPSGTHALAPSPKPEPERVPTPVRRTDSAPIPVAKPETVPAPAPRPAKRESAAAPRAPAPAPEPRDPAAAPSVPAARAVEPLPATASGFELKPAVERFLTEWLGALASGDRARLEALGFLGEPEEFAGKPGSRDDFRLVAVEVDEERSQAGRVYLRLIVSYAFRDATGRFRTQDEQRFILNDAGGRLRFEGRWRQ